MFKRTQALNRSMPNQWARSASMSPGTQACNLAMPNQWHDQHQCLHGHKYATINAKPMARSAINVYTDTSMQLSMSNQWARSSTHLFRTRTSSR